MNLYTIESKTPWKRKLLAAAVAAAFTITASFAFADAGSANAAVSQEQTNDALTQKQSEIDAYVFETHAKELAERGIQVTNTGVIGDAVEIGIADFTDEKAAYLYGVFGTEQVKVVEGEQAVLLIGGMAATTSAANAGAEAASEPLAATDDAAEPSAGASASSLPWIAAIAVAALAGIALMTRKLRVFNK